MMRCFPQPSMTKPAPSSERGSTIREVLQDNGEKVQHVIALGYSPATSQEEFIFEHTHAEHTQ